jgi:beta-glucosidase
VEASVDRPVKELRGFAKVFLAPGETKTISIELNKRDLSFWDVETNNWLAESGEFRVLLGTSLADIHLEKTLVFGN